MEIKAFYDTRPFTVTYVVYDPASRDAVIIDPVLDYDPASGRTMNASAQALIDYIKSESLECSGFSRPMRTPTICLQRPSCKRKSVVSSPSGARSSAFSTLRKTGDADTAHMAERNKLAKPDQVIREDGSLVNDSHITSKDIADAVRSYKMSKNAGLGLAFIVDRLVKSEGKGAVYLVWFDISTRDVLASERVIAKAGGVGFGNYWFGVIKNAESELKKYR